MHAICAHGTLSEPALALQVEESMLLQMQQRAEEEAVAMADVASHVIEHASQGLDLTFSGAVQGAGCRLWLAGCRVQGTGWS